MRAWQVQGTGSPTTVMRLVELDPPEPGPGMVRLDVSAAGVGFPDVLMCLGTYPLTPSGRFTPGQEVVGTVEAVGDGVDEALLGRRVMGVTAFYTGNGGFADQALASAATLFEAPDTMADPQAAAFTIPYHTGWIGLHTRGRVQPGETVVVLGAAGGTGAAAIQLAKVLDATVIAVAGGPDKGAFCSSLGADVVIDHQVADVTESIKEITEGYGADVVYDPVGGDAAKAALGAMANEARHLLVGFASGSWANPDPLDITIGNYSLVGVYVGAYGQPELEEIHDLLLDRFAAGALSSIVTRQIELEQLADAMDDLEQRSAMGKTVVTVGA